MITVTILVAHIIAHSKKKPNNWLNKAPLVKLNFQRAWSWAEKSSQEQAVAETPQAAQPDTAKEIHSRSSQTPSCQNIRHQIIHLKKLFNKRKKIFSILWQETSFNSSWTLCLHTTANVVCDCTVSFLQILITPPEYCRLQIAPKLNNAGLLLVSPTKNKQTPKPNGKQMNTR